MSESWLTEAIPNKSIKIEGYDTTRLDRSWNDNSEGGFHPPKKGGGLICYVKEGIKYSDSKHKHLNISCKDLEMMWINVSIDNVRPIVVVNVYRPPQGNCTRCELISNAFDRADLKDNTDIFVMGDFNINYGDKSTTAYKELNFTTKSLGLRQLINSPTRTAFRDGTPTESTLDLIFTNSDYIAGSQTLDFNISDHVGIMATRKKNPVKTNKIEFKGRSYRNYVKEDFQESLIRADWEAFYNSNDPNWMWDFMYKTILSNIDAMCPIKSFKVTEFREVWMTNEAIEAIKDKDRAMRRAKRSRREDDWVEARRMRNRVGRDIENLRANYLKDQQEANREDPKKFWKNISSIMPGKKGSQSRVWLKSNEGADVNLNDTAGYINDFFTNIGPNLAKKHNAEWRYYGDIVQDSMEDITTNLDEVLKFAKRSR